MKDAAGPWQKASEATIEDDVEYLVIIDGSSIIPDKSVMAGSMVRARQQEATGRPVWIAKLNDPPDLP